MSHVTVSRDDGATTIAPAAVAASTMVAMPLNAVLLAPCRATIRGAGVVGVYVDGTKT